MSKTMNNANGVKNSNTEAQRQIARRQMANNVVNYIQSALGIDDDFKVTEIDEKYGLLTVTNDRFTVEIDFNGRLFQFKTNDGEFLDDSDFLEITNIYENKEDIITAMFENVEHPDIVYYIYDVNY